jgi:hypothetical protein
VLLGDLMYVEVAGSHVGSEELDFPHRPAVPKASRITPVTASTDLFLIMNT